MERKTSTILKPWAHFDVVVLILRVDAMLLFGGKLDVQAAKGVIVIDEWMHLAANARIGALIGGLRGKVEDLLTKKITDPRFDIASTLEMQIIVNLLQTDGLGQ